MDKKEDVFGEISQEELQREADEIRALIDSDPELEEVHVTDEMHNRLMERIKKCEEEQAVSRLSEEDQEALRLGKELQNKRRKRCGRKNYKIWLAVTASLVVVAGVSVTSVGSRNRIVEMFAKAFGDGEKTYVDSGRENIREAGTTEQEAYADIKEAFGIDVVRMGYKPQEAVFTDFQLDQELQEAVLYYSVGDNLMSFRIVSRYVESSVGIDLEDQLQQEYEMQLPETTVKVQEYKIKETGELEYTAQFDYKNSKYFLTGIAEKGEFEEILKNLHFF